MLGDLKGSGPHPDHKQALQLHTQALMAAYALVPDKHPAIRIAAKEVLAGRPSRGFARHCLGRVARKGSFGRELDRQGHGYCPGPGQDGGRQRRVSLPRKQAALAADVALQGKLDPAKWAKEVVRGGEVLINAAPEPGRKAELQWQVAKSLYDAMQVYQLRGNADEALRQGELAIGYLEKSGRQNTSPSAAYLLGRTYFRIGAVYANNRQDHKTAVTWFEKAIPLLGKSPPQEATTDLARLGDAFVSMGVSYWYADHKKKAVALTEHGTELIEESVRRGRTIAACW